MKNLKQLFTSVPYTEMNESIEPTENNDQTIFFLLIFIIIVCFLLYYWYYIKKSKKREPTKLRTNNNVNEILSKQRKQKHVRFSDISNESYFGNIEKRMTAFKKYLQNYLNKIIFYLYTDKKSIKTTKYSSNSSIHRYMNK